ncbi:MAG: hypothetical protein HYX26_09435 [Acidobacteriales bacterium]|nr:hypothetical protein [Terriglobales bacterium]
MRSCRSALVAVFAAATLMVSTAAQTPGMKVKGTRKAKTHAPSPAPAPVQAVVPGPQVPLRPAQMPALAPRIRYAGGQLTVVAENCTMLDILAGIRQATGIKIDAPTSMNVNDRVAAKIGPAPVRSVLLSLFSGAPFDYVILGSATDPDHVERVVLAPRLGAGTVASASGPQRPAPAQVPQRTVETPEDDENEGFAEPQQPAQPSPDQNQQNPPQQPDPNQGREPRGERPR